jgi:hypothetical protein
VKDFDVVDEQPIIVFIIMQSIQGHIVQGEGKKDQDVEQQEYPKSVKMFTNYVDTTSTNTKALGCFKQHPKFANLEGATTD